MACMWVWLKSICSWRYELHLKCKGSFKDSQWKCKYSKILAKIHNRYMESKTISDVTSICTITCMTTVGHTGDDIAHPSPRNVLAFTLKCNTNFLEKYMGSLIFCSTYIWPSNYTVHITFTILYENSVNPDWQASDKASWSGFILFFSHTKKWTCTIGLAGRT